MTPAPPPSFTKKYTLLGPEITMTHDRGENFPEMLHVRGVSYGHGLDCWVRQQCKTGEIFFFKFYFSNLFQNKKRKQQSSSSLKERRLKQELVTSGFIESPDVRYTCNFKLYECTAD